VKLGVSTKAAMALLSVLADAAIDEEPLWKTFCSTWIRKPIAAARLTAARSDSRHRQTVVKRNSDHKDDHHLGSR
jgi:hypothetical protein